MSSLTDRLIIKININIDNDNQEKVEDYFKQYMDYLNGGDKIINKDEHNKICLAYINYQVGKSEDKK